MRQRLLYRLCRYSQLDAKVSVGCPRNFPRCRLSFALSVCSCRLQATSRDKTLKDSEFSLFLPSHNYTRIRHPKIIIADMSIDPPLENGAHSTKAAPGKQNGLPTHSSHNEAAMKPTPSISSDAIVQAHKATDIFYRRCLRTCHHQRQRLWPLRNRKHLSRYLHSQRITLDHHIAVVAT